MNQPDDKRREALMEAERYLKWPEMPPSDRITLLIAQEFVDIARSASEPSSKTLYALEVALEKIKLYYVEHGPEYVGGLEYSVLVKMLDDEIQTLRTAPSSVAAPSLYDELAHMNVVLEESERRDFLAAAAEHVKNHPSDDSLHARQSRLLLALDKEARSAIGPRIPGVSRTIEDKLAILEEKMRAMVRWLDENQADVWRRGIWDAINDAEQRMQATTDSGAK